MEYKFKMNSVFRGIASFAAVLFSLLSLYFLVDIHRYPQYHSLESLITFLFFIAFALSSSFLAFILNKIEYIITSDEFVLRNPIRKDKKYHISRIERIDREHLSFFPSVEIFFRGKKGAVTFMPSSEKKFVEIVKSKLNPGVRTITVIF